MLCTHDHLVTAESKVPMSVQTTITTERPNRDHTGKQWFIWSNKCMVLYVDNCYIAVE